jgi:hypothetical protein
MDDYSLRKSWAEKSGHWFLLKDEFIKHGLCTEEEFNNEYYSMIWASRLGWMWYECYKELMTCNICTPEQFIQRLVQEKPDILAEIATTARQLASFHETFRKAGLSQALASYNCQSEDKEQALLQLLETKVSPQLPPNLRALLITGYLKLYQSKLTRKS